MLVGDSRRHRSFVHLFSYLLPLDGATAGLRQQLGKTFFLQHSISDERSGKDAHYGFEHNRVKQIAVQPRRVATL